MGANQRVELASFCHSGPRPIRYRGPSLPLVFWRYFYSFSGLVPIIAMDNGPRKSVLWEGSQYLLEMERITNTASGRSYYQDTEVAALA